MEIPSWSDYPGAAALRGKMVSMIMHRLLMSEDADWYNDDTNFSEMLQLSLAVKQNLMKCPIQLDFRYIPQLREAHQFAPELWQECGQYIKTLRVNQCPNLVALPEEVRFLEKLEFFNVWGCPRLSSIPAGLSECRALRRIKVCGPITSMPDLSGAPDLRLHQCDGEHWTKPWLAGGKKAWKRDA